jgi:hypothetical protein
MLQLFNFDYQPVCLSNVSYVVNYSVHILCAWISTRSNIQFKNINHAFFFETKLWILLSKDMQKNWIPGKKTSSSHTPAVKKWQMFFFSKIKYKKIKKRKRLKWFLDEELRLWDGQLCHRRCHKCQIQLSCLIRYAGGWLNYTTSLADSRKEVVLSQNSPFL